MQIHYQPARKAPFAVSEHASVVFGKNDLRVGTTPDGRVVLFGYEPGDGGDTLELVATVTISAAQAQQIARAAEVIGKIAIRTIFADTEGKAK